MNERIFVIDQDVHAREFLYDIFSELGFSVLTIPPGPHVLDHLKKERPILILLEDGKGEFSGFDLIRKIRPFDTDIKIVLTGLVPDTRLYAAEMSELRVSAYLKRDFQNPDFIKDVIALTKGSSLPPDAARGTRTWGRVLIVDDEVENRETASRYLHRHGFDTETASSGEECLEMVRHSDFDIVLLDITMTGMDGLLTLKRIKEFKPGLQVVMVTALQNKDVAADARQMGASDYIIKPFNFDTLESTLVSLLLPKKIARAKSA